MIRDKKLECDDHHTFEDRNVRLAVRVHPPSAASDHLGRPALDYARGRVASSAALRLLETWRATGARALRVLYRAKCIFELASGHLRRAARPTFHPGDSLCAAGNPPGETLGAEPAHKTLRQCAFLSSRWPATTQRVHDLDRCGLGGDVEGTSTSADCCIDKSYAPISDPRLWCHAEQL